MRVCVSNNFKSFEWLIVDDGSEDHTQALVRAWQQESKFSIRYEYQSNRGKHIAMNRGVALAKGVMFLPIDSDDGFNAEALEQLNNVWEAIPESEKAGFTGVVCRCRYEDGIPCSPVFAFEPFDSNSLDLRFKLKVRGELWGFHRTEVLKQFPFPEVEGISFIPENIVWDAIARYYKVRCINATLRIFYQDSGNQLTKRQPAQKAPQRRFFLTFINRDIDYFWNDPLTFMKWAILYVRYSLHAQDKGFLSALKFQSFLSYLLCCLALMPGLGLFFLDQHLHARERRV